MAFIYVQTIREVCRSQNLVLLFKMLSATINVNILFQFSLSLSQCVIVFPPLLFVTFYPVILPSIKHLLYLSNLVGRKQKSEESYPYIVHWLKYFIYIYKYIYKYINDYNERGVEQLIYNNQLDVLELGWSYISLWQFNCIVTAQLNLN